MKGGVPLPGNLLEVFQGLLTCQGFKGGEIWGLLGPEGKAEYKCFNK